VQGPSPASANAWERGKTAGLNAFVFHARSTRPVTMRLVLRVRDRKVMGPKGVRGHFRASVAIRGPKWQQYAVRFDDFKGTKQLGRVGDALFRKWWPQVQFHVSPGKSGAARPTVVWVDDLAFGAAGESSSGETPMVFPGLDQLPKLRPAFGKASKTRVPQARNARARAAVNDAWTFVPFDNEKNALASPTEVAFPHGWPGKRSFSAGWYLRNLHVPAAMPSRVVFQFERVGYYCAVFIDEAKVGEHAGGYTPFEIDLTRAATPGAHRLAVYVMDSTYSVRGGRALHQMGVMKPNTSRPRGGMWGRVWIEARPQMHIADVFVKTSFRNREIAVECDLCNQSRSAANGALRLSVREWKSGKPADARLPDTQVTVGAGKTRTVEVRAPWPRPKLWSHEHPHLYVLRAELEGDGIADSFEQRFGFREFWCEGGQFVLNGVPTRLRGQSNLKGHSMIPLSLNRGYWRTVFRAYRDEFGVNAFRVHASIGSDPVFEVADEEGMLLIDQSSIWSAMGGHYRRGGKQFLENTRKEFEEWVRRDRNHPSVVIWDSENEMIRGGGREDNTEWVMQLDEFIRRWDTTRPIEHSGAGWHAPDQQIYHVHMEEHYTKLFELWSKSPDKPLINGEYWVGGRGETRLPTSKEAASHAEFYAEEARSYHEAIIEQRAYGVPGVMPFTIWRTAFERLAKKWTRVPPDASDPDPRPRGGFLYFNPGWLADVPPYRIRAGVAALLRNGLGPETAFFWPRVEAAIVGQGAERAIVVCNDSERKQSLDVRWGIDDREAESKRLSLDPGEMRRIPVTMDTPPTAGSHALFVEIARDGTTLTRDTLPVRALPSAKLRPPRLKRTLLCTDAAGLVAPALAKHGIDVTPTDGVPKDAETSIWIIGPDASDRRIDRMTAPIRQHLAAGGRVLCLSQPALPKWSPARFNSWSAVRQTPVAFAGFGWKDGWKEVYYSRHAPIYAPGHPVFDGLPFDDARWWNAVDGRVSDDALVRPAATGAVAPGNWRPLLGGTRRENMSLAEVFVGEGVLLLCPAQVVRQIANAEARLLLWNMLRYLDRPNVTPTRRALHLVGKGLANRVRLLTCVELAEHRSPPTSGKGNDVIIAGAGADAKALTSWSQRTGGTVLVLSAKVSTSFDGLKAYAKPEFTYSACRGEPHWLFEGLGSSSFEDMDRPAVKGEFVEVPKGARVLLRGRRGPDRTARDRTVRLGLIGPVGLDGAGPVAVELKAGAGTIVATTLEPFDTASAHAAEVLSIILTNAGVPIEPPIKTAARVRTLRTVPVKLDGKLDDWTNDVEDRNVSPYRHAEPVVLGADTLVNGELVGDQDLSGIVYFLWDDDSLYVAGLAAGRTHGSADISVRLADSTVRLRATATGWDVKLSPSRQATVRCHSTPVADVARFIDARFLTFAEIDARVGNVRPVRGRVPGRTFELRIPWRVIGLKPKASVPFAVELRRGEDTLLRVPTGAEGEMGTLAFAE